MGWYRVRGGATIDSSGVFRWSPGSSVATGLYQFRISLMGMLDGGAVSDEATLFVLVSNDARFMVTLGVNPPEGGSVSGGGVYGDGSLATLRASAEPGWSFAGWSDGLTSESRTMRVRRNVGLTANFVYVMLPPAVAGGTKIDGVPLLYWSALSGAEGYGVERAVSRDGPFTRLATVVDNIYHDTAPLGGEGGYYRIVALHGGQTASVSQVFQVYPSGEVRKLRGVVIGSLGSWSNHGNTREKVFDGDIDSFYDSDGDGGWPGQDYSIKMWRRISHLRYAPRETFPQRMPGGEFQISSNSDGVATFEVQEVIHTIVNLPPVRVYTQVDLAQDYNFRYLRYMPPKGGNGNIAELEVYGCDAVPGVVLMADIAGGVRQIVVVWQEVAMAQGYLVEVAAGASGPFEVVGFSEDTSYIAEGIGDGETCYFRVAAVNGSGMSTRSAVVSGSSTPLPEVPEFKAVGGGRGVSVSGGVVSLRLSGVLDSRLELVSSESLDVPVSEWQVVEGASFGEPDPLDGSIVVVVESGAPRLFFAVRLRR